MFRDTCFKRVFFVIAIGFIVGLPLLAAAAPSASFNSATRSGCIITMNVTVGDAGTYYLHVWDDGALIDVQAFAASAGQTLDIFYTIKKPAGTGAAGIGLEIADGPTGSAVSFASIDPFIYPDDVANNCAAAYAAPAAAGCSLNIPAGSVVGRIATKAEVFWAPGKISPGVTLNPGTYWAVAQELDENGRPYYKIVLACQFVYVDARVMQPSYESPWNGQPLPVVPPTKTP